VTVFGDGGAVDCWQSWRKHVTVVSLMATWHGNLRTTTTQEVLVYALVLAFDMLASLAVAVELPSLVI